MGEGRGEIKIVGISKYLKMSGKDWKDFVMEKDGEVFVEEIRKATNMSRAMGSEGFVRKLEKKLGISLKLIRQGRPTKTK